ncbi:hypothetical protein [endosymbiont of Riftia pachyptila]|uniref:hypothetical protein n=1 Tax=endosymbiont of Riftia pachyptila TaxID=54396 RepID=UPI003B84A3A4
MSMKSDQPDMNRRKLLGTTLAASGAVVVAPGVLLHASPVQELRQKAPPPSTAGGC